LIVQALQPSQAAAAAALLGRLRVSLFGIASPRLHQALVADALCGLVDCRVALEQSALAGIVMAAPARYWRVAPRRHLRLAVECIAARLEHGVRPRPAPPPDTRSERPERPSPAGAAPLTWAEPGDAWRIIFVGTAPEHRGQGVAARLYRDLMADRSLVARIAPDNQASIRLHQSLGWRVGADGDVLLAVHTRGYSAEAAAG
jgi:ribosomal protein S18 acetylase RimI-like enzyme